MKKAEPNGRRLIDIEVEEVSLVGKAANGRKFLIVKQQQEGIMDADVQLAKDKPGEVKPPEAPAPAPTPVVKADDPKPPETPPAEPGKETPPAEAPPAPAPPAEPEKIEKQDMAAYGDAIPKLIAAVQDVIGTLMEALKAIGYGYKKEAGAEGNVATLAAEIQKASESLKGIQVRMAKVSKGENPDAPPPAPAPAEASGELKTILEEIQKVQKSVDGIDTRLKAVESAPRQISKGEGDGGDPPQPPKSVFAGLL